LLLLGVFDGLRSSRSGTSIPRYYAASLVARMWQFHTMILLVTAIARGATSLQGGSDEERAQELQLALSVAFPDLHADH
jgi:hypothetical protein